MVPEMVFLLGRMGNNREALTLIIERLGDVNRVRILAGLITDPVGDFLALILSPHI